MHLMAEIPCPPTTDGARLGFITALKVDQVPQELFVVERARYRSGTKEPDRLAQVVFQPIGWGGADELTHPGVRSRERPCLGQRRTQPPPPPLVCLVVGVEREEPGDEQTLVLVVFGDLAR